MRTLLILLCFLLALVAFAQDERDAAPEKPQPQTVYLHNESYKIGPKGQFAQVRLSVVIKPTDYSIDLPNNRPLKADDIDPSTSFGRSPFYLDIYLRKNGKLRHVSHVRFFEESGCGAIKTDFLRPARKEGPIIRLRFGAADNGTWHTITFPNGLEKEGVHQVFGFASDSEDYYIDLRFDKTDKRGYRIFDEHWGEGIHKSGHTVYEWDGSYFVDKKAAYFLIAASVKTRAEAVAYMFRSKHTDEAEIVESKRYPKLTPGSFVVIVARRQKLDEAQDLADGYANNGIHCYVKKAF